MSQTRLNLLKNKRTNSIYAKKQEIAQLLRAGKEDLALIKVESVINDENYIAAIDILALYCAQLKERFKVICDQGNPPVDMLRALHTVFYAAPRSQCQELEVIQEQLFARYGPKFAESARDNSEQLVDLIVVAKLEATLPEHELKVAKLREIAVEAHVEYAPKDEILDQVQNGLSIPAAPLQPGQFGGYGSPGMVSPQMSGSYAPMGQPASVPQPMMPTAPRMSTMTDGTSAASDCRYPSMTYQPQPMGAYVPVAPAPTGYQPSSLDPGVSAMPPAPPMSQGPPPGMPMAPPPAAPPANPMGPPPNLPMAPPAAPMGSGLPSAPSAPPASSSQPKNVDDELEALKARLNNLK